MKVFRLRSHASALLTASTDLARDAKTAAQEGPLKPYAAELTAIAETIERSRARLVAIAETFEEPRK